MLHKNALALLLFLPAIWLSAQPYQEDWDQILGDFARESSIRQLYQAANGAVYAVGQFRAVANDQDGLLLRLDESTGKVESQTPFSRSGDDGLTDLCAAPAGGLWLAGFSANARGEGRYPRLIQVDYQLAPVKDRVFTELADEQFTHVAAFANGDLLLCGRYENRRETALAFYFFRQGQLVAVDALQNYRSLLENVVDVLPSPDERTLYIVANSRRGRGSEEGRLYILALRDDGNPPSVFQTSENEYYVARAATLAA